MPVLQFESVIPAPLAAVWAFYADVNRALPALSPPGDGVRVEPVELPVRVGTRIVIHARGPLGLPVRWVAVIVEVEPPAESTTGPSAARFVDEQASGPFARWRHEHAFESVGANATRVTDRIAYRVPLGPLGWIGDRLYVRRRLAKMFAHRQAATGRHFGTVPVGRSCHELGSPSGAAAGPGDPAGSETAPESVLRALNGETVTRVFNPCLTTWPDGTPAVVGRREARVENPCHAKRAPPCS